MDKIEKTIREEVEFAIEALPEDSQIRGNCSAIDPETDAATEAEIIRQLNAGNEWAWCTVKVSAKWRGLTGVDYLGCCSYASMMDFISPGGYYEDMKEQALAQLVEEVRSVQIPAEVK